MHSVCLFDSAVSELVSNTIMLLESEAADVSLLKLTKSSPAPPKFLQKTIHKKLLHISFTIKICLWRVVLVCKLTDNTVN